MSVRLKQIRSTFRIIPKLNDLTKVQNMAAPEAAEREKSKVHLSKFTDVGFNEQ